LLQLHSLLIRIRESAEATRDALESIKQSIQNVELHLYTQDAPRIFRRLNYRLGEQRACLTELQDLPRETKDFVNVYGNECGQEIEKLTGVKVSFLDLLTNLCLGDAPYAVLHFTPGPQVSLSLLSLKLRMRSGNDQRTLRNNFLSVNALV
jgi:hypothetical protein